MLDRLETVLREAATLSLLSMTKAANAVAMPVRVAPYCKGMSRTLLNFEQGPLLVRYGIEVDDW
jgi:hypothetical protein